MGPLNGPAVAATPLGAKQQAATHKIDHEDWSNTHDWLATSAAVAAATARVNLMAVFGLGQPFYRKNTVETGVVSMT